jgi:hypothetical protein
MEGHDMLWRLLLAYVYDVAYRDMRGVRVTTAVVLIDWPYSSTYSPRKSSMYWK